MRSLCGTHKPATRQSQHFVSLSSGELVLNGALLTGYYPKAGDANVLPSTKIVRSLQIGVCSAADHAIDRTEPAWSQKLATSYSHWSATSAF